VTPFGLFNFFSGAIAAMFERRETSRVDMSIPRLTFLSHFVICLACGALAFFAFANGVPQTLFANDQSMMTSVIGALFFGSVVYLGREAWLVGEPRIKDRGPMGDPSSVRSPSSDYGHLAERLCVMGGFVGTAIGLSLQAKALAGGATSFTALATSLFTTATGGTAAAVIAILTFNVEAGIRRSRRQ
jgi:hypothetical protein